MIHLSLGWGNAHLEIQRAWVRCWQFSYGRKWTNGPIYFDLTLWSINIHFDTCHIPF